MHIGWLIGASGSSLLMFICFVIFSTINYKKRFSLKYDMRNHFPYEYNYDSSFKDNPFGNICLLISMLFSLALFSMTSAFFNVNGILIFCLIAGAIYSIIAFFIVFVSLKRITLHVVCAVLLSCFAFLTPSSIGLAAFQHYQKTKSVICLILFILCVIVGLFNFALIMNPKFTFNIKMKKIKLNNGEEQVVRPNIIVIAFSEWMMLFSLFVTQVLLIVTIVNL